MLEKTGKENEGECNIETEEEYWRRVAYYRIIDTLIINLKSRFSTESLLLATSLDSFLKMDSKNSEYFNNQYQVNFENLKIFF